MNDESKKGTPAGGGHNGSDREDPNRSESGYQRFAKDKRARVNRAEKIPRERKPDTERDDRPQGEDRFRDTRRPRTGSEDRPPYRQNERKDDRPYRKDDRREGGYPPRDDRGRRDGNDRNSRPDRGYSRDDSRDRRDPGYGNRDSRTGKEYSRGDQGSRSSGSYPRDDRNRGQDGSDRPRRSYNPNFTPDNRRTDDRKPYRSDKPFNDDDRWNRVDYDPEQDRRRSPSKPQNRSGRPEGSPYRQGPGRGGRDGGFSSDNRSGGYRAPGRNDRYGSDRGDRKPYDKNRRDGSRESGKYRRPDGDYPKFAPPKIDKAIRLNRFLAMSGIASRREADDLITAGVVTVNGEVVTELGSKVQPTDVVRFNDSIVRGEKKVYILMNKPKGYVTTLEDPHAEKTVMDIIKGAVQERVYPVGRLDKNSLGVLLITNDGDMTKHLTHPTYRKKKIYQVTLDKALTRNDMEEIAEGIELDDGPIRADDIAYVGDSKKEIGIEIHSGRNRVVRRIFEHLGYKVQKLDRVYFAGLTKKRLKRGAWRFLTPKEVAILKSGEYE